MTAVQPGGGGLCAPATEVARREDDPWTRPGGLVVAMVTLAIWGAVVIPGLRWQMNSDGVSYLSLAGKYVAGELGAAVNAYWSPLYSWLLALLLALGVEPLLATKILALLVGEGILVVVWWLSANLDIPRDGRLLVCLTICPILIYFGMTITTPDLLVSGVVLLYLAHLTSPQDADGTSRGRRAIAGALGGVAYLAKAYALQFVVLHLTMVNASDLLHTRHERRRVLLAALAAYAGLLVVTAPWVACLTVKYGELTTSSAARFNLALNGPGFRIPMFEQGFLPPSDPYAASAWDDGTLLRFAAWNPMASAADRAYYSRNVVRNVRALASMGRSFTILVWPIVLGAVACALLVRDRFRRRVGSIVVGGFLLFHVGFVLLHVVERFLSLTCILLVILGAWVVTSGARAVGRGALSRRVATALVCASFLCVPGWSVPKPDADGTEPSALRLALGRWSVAREWHAQRQFARLADQLRQVIPAGASVASANYWDAALFVSYHLGTRYWGVPAPDASPEQVRADLVAKGIEYFWFWGLPKRFPVVAGWPRIRVPGMDLPLYRVPNEQAGTGPRDADLRGGARRSEE